MIIVTLVFFARLVGIIVPPIVLYLKDIGGFINILAITGSAGMGILGFYGFDETQNG